MFFIIFLISIYFSGNLLISILIITFIALYIFIHETGHIIFLKQFQVSFSYRTKHLSFYIDIDEKAFLQLERKQQLLIIFGGPAFSALFLMIAFSVTFIFQEELSMREIWILLFVLLLSEVYGITFGTDGQALEKVMDIKAEG
jgi:hypothetical protein